MGWDCCSLLPPATLKGPGCGVQGTDPHGVFTVWVQEGRVPCSRHNKSYLNCP